MVQGLAVSDTGWRGSFEAWLDAAYDALLEGGVEAVRIQALAGRLKLSRTSFYWFFKDREALLEALIEKWQLKNSSAIARQASAYAENIGDAILNLFDCWLNRELFDSQFEYAIRCWSLQSDDVARKVRAADEERLRVLTHMFRRFDYDELQADTRARATYLTQIGYISMQTVEPEHERMARMRDYVRIFSGMPVEERLLKRFYARHNYTA